MATNQSASERADELRRIAEEKNRLASALQDLLDEALSADTIGETRLSKLFHEARTNRPDTWITATAFIDVEDGEAVVDSVLKLREGRWTPEKRDSHDAVLSIPVRPFMDSDMFRSLLRDSLRENIRLFESSADKHCQDANAIERTGL